MPQDKKKDTDSFAPDSFAADSAGTKDSFAADSFAPDATQSQGEKPAPSSVQLSGRTFLGQLQRTIGSPFESLAKTILPGNKTVSDVGSLADSFFMGGVNNVVSGVQKMGDSSQAPDKETQMLERLAAAKRIGFGVAGVGPLAIPMGAWGAGQRAVDIVSPGTGAAIQKISTPIESLTQPTTRAGKAAAELADAPLQMYAYGKLGKGMKMAGEAVGITPKGSPAAPGAGTKAFSGMYDPQIDSQIHKDNAAKLIRDVIPPSQAASKAKAAHQYDQTVDRTLGYLNDAASKVPPSGDVPTIERVENIAKQARNDLYEKTKQPSDALKDVKVNLLDDVLKKLDDSLTTAFKKTRSSEYEAMKVYLKEAYKNDLTMPEIFDHLRELNAQLATRFYEKAPEAQARLNNNPNALKLDAIAADAVRERYFDVLKQNGFKDIDQLRRDYGAVSTVHRLFYETAEKNQRLDDKTIWRRNIKDDPLHNAWLMGVLGHIMGFGRGVKATTEIAAGILTAARNASVKPSAKMDKMLSELERSGVKAPNINTTKPPTPPPPPPGTGVIPSQQPPSGGTPPPPTGGQPTSIKVRLNAGQNPNVQDAKFQDIPPDQLPPATPKQLPAGTQAQPSTSQQATEQSKPPSQQSLDALPPEQTEAIKTHAQELYDELKSGFTEAAPQMPVIEGQGAESDVVGHTRGFRVSTNPEWFKNIGRSKEDILKNLQKIIEDDPKNSLAQELKTLIDQHLKEGYQGNKVAPKTLKTKGGNSYSFSEEPPF